MQPLTIYGTPLRTNAQGLVSLTDLFKAAEAQGQADGKSDPREWQRRQGSQFIDHVAKELNVARSHIQFSQRGKGGGTWAHWQIALAYAKYLSHDLHMQVNEVFARFKTGDVTLAADIAERASHEKAEWLARRTAGIVARKGLTDTLSQHGVKGFGYARCTNNIYSGVFGGTKSEIVERNKLPAKANLRDHMSAEQLIAVAMSELVAKKRIVRNDAQGNDRCAAECLGASRSVMDLIGKE